MSTALAGFLAKIKKSISKLLRTQVKPDEEAGQPSLMETIQTQVEEVEEEVGRLLKEKDRKIAELEREVLDLKEYKIEIAGSLDKCEYLFGSYRDNIVADINRFANHFRLRTLEMDDSVMNVKIFHKVHQDPDKIQISPRLTLYLRRVLCGNSYPDCFEHELVKTHLFQALTVAAILESTYTETPEKEHDCRTLIAHTRSILQECRTPQLLLDLYTAASNHGRAVFQEESAFKTNFATKAKESALQFVKDISPLFMAKDASGEPVDIISSSDKVHPGLEDWLVKLEQCFLFGMEFGNAIRKQVEELPKYIWPDMNMPCNSCIMTCVTPVPGEDRVEEVEKGQKIITTFPAFQNPGFGKRGTQPTVPYCVRADVHVDPESPPNNISPPEAPLQLEVTKQAGTDYVLSSGPNEDESPLRDMENSEQPSNRQEVGGQAPSSVLLLEGSAEQSSSANVVSSGSAKRKSLARDGESTEHRAKRQAIEQPNTVIDASKAPLLVSPLEGRAGRSNTADFVSSGSTKRKSPDWYEVSSGPPQKVHKEIGKSPSFVPRVEEVAAGQTISPVLWTTAPATTQVHAASMDHFTRPETTSLGLVSQQATRQPVVQQQPVFGSNILQPPFGAAFNRGTVSTFGAFGAGSGLGLKTSPWGTAALNNNKPIADKPDLPTFGSSTFGTPSAHATFAKSFQSVISAPQAKRNRLSAEDGADQRPPKRPRLDEVVEEQGPARQPTRGHSSLEDSAESSGDGADQKPSERQRLDKAAEAPISDQSHSGLAEQISTPQPDQHLPSIENGEDAGPSPLASLLNTKAQSPDPASVQPPPSLSALASSDDLPSKELFQPLPTPSQNTVTPSTPEELLQSPPPPSENNVEPSLSEEMLQSPRRPSENAVTPSSPKESLQSAPTTSSNAVDPAPRFGFLSEAKTVLSRPTKRKSSDRDEKSSESPRKRQKLRDVASEEEHHYLRIPPQNSADASSSEEVSQSPPRSSGNAVTLSSPKELLQSASTSAANAADPPSSEELLQPPELPSQDLIQPPASLVDTAVPSQAPVSGTQFPSPTSPEESPIKTTPIPLASPVAPTLPLSENVAGPSSSIKTTASQEQQSGSSSARATCRGIRPTGERCKNLPTRASNAAAASNYCRHHKGQAPSDGSGQMSQIDNRSGTTIEGAKRPTDGEVSKQLPEPAVALSASNPSDDDEAGRAGTVSKAKEKKAKRPQGHAGATSAASAEGKLENTSRPVTRSEANRLEANRLAAEASQLGTTTSAVSANGEEANAVAEPGRSRQSPRNRSVIGSGVEKSAAKSGNKRKASSSGSADAAEGSASSSKKQRTE